MQKKYKATIKTKGEDSFSFEWSIPYSEVSKGKHCAEIFLSYSHYIVKDNKDGVVVVPREAIDSVKLKEIEREEY